MANKDLPVNLLTVREHIGSSCYAGLNRKLPKECGRHAESRLKIHSLKICLEIIMKRKTPEMSVFFSEVLNL